MLDQLPVFQLSEMNQGKAEVIASSMIWEGICGSCDHCRPQQLCPHLASAALIHRHATLRNVTYTCRKVVLLFSKRETCAHSGKNRYIPLYKRIDLGGRDYLCPQTLLES